MLYLLALLLSSQAQAEGLAMPESKESQTVEVCITKVGRQQIVTNSEVPEFEGERAHGLVQKSGTASERQNGDQQY